MLKRTGHVLHAFVGDESGLSAVEYGLLAAGIAVGLWTLISGIGSSLHDIFQSVQDDLGQATP
ncbi:MAG TPA: Flp family type IVb pilin [Rhizomicrobium sp.]|nr:Flp family type IVb pilin [Rhizomicrobium sp.]